MQREAGQQPVLAEPPPAGGGALSVTLPGPGQRLDIDHDVADLAARLDIPVGLDDLVQPIPPADQRPERPGLQHLP
jgi:hypothetical protein